MNKIKMLLLVMVVALLFAACNKPDENPTDPTGQTDATEQVTEATEPNLPGVEENQFSEEDILIPTDPIVETTGNESGSGNNEGGVANTGNGNQGSSGNQGGSGNNSGSGNQGGSGNNGGSGNQGTSGGADQPANPTNPSGEIVYVTYEEYNNMTPDEQVAYFNQFPSMEAFVEWYNEAKDEYDKENGAIEIGGDGSVDLGEIVKP